MRTVEFKFDLDQRILTGFGDKGIIESLSLQEGGINYYVKTNQGGMWWKESDLTAKEE